MSKVKRSPKQWESLRKKEKMFREKKVLKERLKSLQHELDNIGKDGLSNEVKSIQSKMKEKDTSEMLYHLTTPNKWKKIQEQGLKGGGKNRKEYKDKGWLFLVDTDEMRVWNGISSNSLVRKQQIVNPNWLNRYGNPVTMFDRQKHPYIVIGIPKVYFEVNGFDLKGDTSKDLSNYKGNHVSVKLDEHIIHPSFLTKVYQGITDQDTYEKVDRWEMSQEMLSIQHGKPVDIESICITDPVFGRIEYSERNKKISTSLLHKPPSYTTSLIMKNQEYINESGLYDHMRTKEHKPESLVGQKRNYQNQSNWSKVVDKMKSITPTPFINQKSNNVEKTQEFGMVG